MGKIIKRDPEILSGTPVFDGTRVPIRILFEHLEAGDSLREFLDDYPSVKESQAKALLQLAKENIDTLDDEAAA